MDFIARMRNSWSAFTLAAFVAVGCSAPSPGPGSNLSRQATIDLVNQALDVGDCVGAVERIEPLYKSASSDNEVRMIAASAYACHSGLQFFTFLDSLTQNAGDLAGKEFWAYLTRTFPSSLSDTSDRKVEGAVLAMDSLMAALKPGIPILPGSYINYPGYNPGSVKLNDRETDANAYLVFVSMAAVGAIQSRYGNPYANGKKGQDLTWSTATSVDDDGCNYASSVLNLVDSLGALASASSRLTSSITAIQTALQGVIHQACDYGCTNTAAAWGGVLSGCTVTTACTSCPERLHDRTACTGQVDDQVSCAAAGIVNFINSSQGVLGLGWEAGP